jgi:hypothetical protein
VLDIVLICPYQLAAMMTSDEKHIPEHLRWVAEEHISVARNMERLHGKLVITLHPIFEYSRLNPPAWMLGRTRTPTRR